MDITAAIERVERDLETYLGVSLHLSADFVERMGLNKDDVMTMRTENPAEVERRRVIFMPQIVQISSDGTRLSHSCVLAPRLGNRLQDDQVESIQRLLDAGVNDDIECPTYYQQGGGVTAVLISPISLARLIETYRS